MYWTSVRDDHAFEGEIEQLLQSRKRPFFVRTASPHPEFSVPLRQGIGKNESTVLRQPKRCFILASAVIERNQTTRKLGTRFDRFQLRSWNIIRPKQRWPKGTNRIKADHEIDVSNVIRLKHNGSCGRPILKPGPHLPVLCWGHQRI